MKIRAKEPAIEIIRRMGIVRPADLEIFGITRARLYSLVQKGLVERRGRGIYVARNHALTAEHVLDCSTGLVPNSNVMRRLLTGHAARLSQKALS